MSALGSDIDMHCKYLDAALQVVNDPLEGIEESVINDCIDCLDDVSMNSIYGCGDPGIIDSFYQGQRSQPVSFESRSLRCWNKRGTLFDAIL